MKSIKGKVITDAKKQLAEYRASDRWLQDAVSFSHGLSLSPEYRKLAKILFDELVGGNIYKRGQKETDLALLLANLISNKRKPVSISLAWDSWKSNRYRRGSRFVIKLMHLLEREGYLTMKKGWRFETTGRMTRIWATEKLLKYMPLIPNAVMDVPVELVELRDQEGKLKEYRDTIETARIRKILQRANAVNEKADVRYENDRLHPALVAIFKEKFTLYGRLHTRGYRHYQGFSGEERKEITINGESVVELDFSGMHPRLLYAEEGIQFSDDPYAIVNNRPEARPFLKQILLCLLNSKDELTAERAGNYWLSRKHKERNALHDIGITRARPIIDAFKQAHKPIAHHFCNGKKTGMRVMNLDAKIALDVINHFVKQDIPILSVHDSFIVQRHYKAELKRTMQRMYRKHTKGFKCLVK